jgi:hypothetical protein
MRKACLVCSTILMAACGGHNPEQSAGGTTDGTMGGTNGGTMSGTNGGTTAGTTSGTTGGTTSGMTGATDATVGPSGMLTFAVFGDARPPNLNDTADYPTQIVSGIFRLAQEKGAQFAVGTGDYMFASSASAVSAQGELLLSAEANFKGPIYHTLGNHECTGATDSNCPNGNETANVQYFMSKLVPSGTAHPWYRVDVDTPLGKAKFLFIAENAWSSDQNTWLQEQLADATAYTFLVRHEPGGSSHSYGAPGLGPSSALIQGHPHTLLVEGHSHEYRHVSANEVISGNGGAPLSSFNGAAYGFLLVQQLTDGNISVSEIDVVSGNATDTWKVTPAGQAAN